VAALFARATPAMTAPTDGTGATADWFVAGNWSNDVPVAADDAALNNGGATDEGQQPRRLQLNASNLP
jgi:hypothetical protein